MFRSQSSASVGEPGKTWGIWSVVGAWGVAAVVAAMIPVALTLLYRQLGIQSRDVEYIFFGILAKPLHGTPLLWLRTASIVYWELGLILLAVMIARDTRWRRLVALLFPTLSIALLFYVVPLLSVVWSLAWKNSCIPTGPWGYNEGNHGLWRHLDPLESILGWAMILPFLTFLVALPGAFFTPRKNVVVAMVASADALLFLFWTFGWLID